MTTEVSKFPETWRVMPIRRVLKRVEQGWSPQALDEEAADSAWGVLKLNAIRAGTFTDHHHKALPSDVVPDPRIEVVPGDLLMTRANSPELVGDVALVRATRPRLMMSDLMYRIVLDRRRLLPEFAVYWFLSLPAVAQIRADARGSNLSMSKISQGHIRSWSVPVPPLATQRQIIAFLDGKTAAIDALIAKKERLTELLQVKRQALVEDAFPWTWRPEVATPGMARLDSILVERKRPLAPVPDQIYQEIGVRSHGRGVFHKEPILGKDLGNKSVFWVTPGDLVFNIVFAWEGAVALTSQAERGLICSHRFPSFYAKDEVLYLPWLVYFFRSREGKRLLELNSPGAAGRNKTLDRRSLMKEYIGLPDVHSQKEVVRRLDDELGHRARTEELLKKQLVVLKEYRQALISAAVTGQLSVDGGGYT